MKKQPLYVIAGPTASGKTSLAVALAKAVGGEVVSADSMQVYQDLHIGTARPSKEEMEGVPHHLMGFLPLSERYSVAQYATDARAAIDEIGRRNALPLLCGGTGLYIQAVTENLLFSEEVTEQSLRVRAELQEEAVRFGGDHLLRKLAAIDSETAARLHSNDHGRIIRALEVFKTTGVPMSEWIRRSRSEPPPYDTHVLVLSFRDRQALYSRIDRRVDQMVEQGLLTEAERVLRSPQAPTAMQAIGYKELAPYFEGTISLDEALDNLKRGTRRYAKRQMSWFRRYDPACVLYMDEQRDQETLLREVCRILKLQDVKDRRWA